MEYGLLAPDEPSALELYVLNMVALGNWYQDLPNPAPKDLGSDISSKWKQDELEYQLRKSHNARAG